MRLVRRRVEQAVCFRRIRPNGRSAFNLLGSDSGVARLVEELPSIADTVEPHRSAHQVFGVSVPQHLETLLHQRFRVMQGGDWEWFHTTLGPPEDVAHERVRPIDDTTRAAEVTAFLETHSPTADTHPGHAPRRDTKRPDFPPAPG